MVEGQRHIENFHMPPVESPPVVHALPQEAVKEGKASVLVLTGRHIGPDGRNFLVGWDSGYVNGGDLS